jgi:hypothetical protein
VANVEPQIREGTPEGAASEREKRGRGFLRRRWQRPVGGMG